MSELYRAKLYILHIAEPEPEFLGYDVGPEYIRIDAAREYRDEHRWVQALADRLKTKKLEAVALLIHGYVAEEILKEADSIDADLIICGSHKRGFFSNLFLPNTSVELAKSSERPLLIFPLEE
jgi:nucleotide-binding universal stress UspA family protein